MVSHPGAESVRLLVVVVVSTRRMDEGVPAAEQCQAVTGASHADEQVAALQRQALLALSGARSGGTHQRGHSAAARPGM